MFPAWTYSNLSFDSLPNVRPLFESKKNRSPINIRFHKDNKHAAKNFPDKSKLEAKTNPSKDNKHSDSITYILAKNPT